MGSAKKELQEQLLNVGNRILVAPPSSVDELLPLLDQAETLLSRVQQSPSDSMLAALHPAMAGLTAKRLLRHSDTDVKVAVAACISEITRITAPEAPYDDDLMKEVFEMIVEAFQKLEDISSRSYLKRVSILETVAKVRSFVVMLDLECDSLIFKMFHHFLSTIRDSHPENVFSSMEMIMTLVLEESEDISSDLLSCLLMSVKKNSKDILPIARKLAEKVIGNCGSKLKPSLMEAVQSMGALLDDYSEIVASTCQGISEVLEQNVIVSGECLAGDSKVAERVLSDEMPQVSQKVESEIACPNVSAATDKLPRSSVSNGTVQRNDNTLGEPTSPRKKTEHSCRSTLPRNETAARLEAEKVGTALDRGTKKARGQKGNSAVQPTGNTHHPPLEASELPDRRKGRGREVNVVPLEKPTDNSASVISAADNGNLPDSNHSKRVRSSGSKISMKKVGTSPAGNGNIKDEPEPYMDIGVKKQTEVTCGSEKKPVRRSGKKGRFENVDNGGKSNSHSDAATDTMADPEEKLHRRPGRKAQTKTANEDEASGKHRTSKTKQQKGRVSSEEIVVEEPKQKGMVSSTMTTPTTKAKKAQNLSEEGLKTKSRKKRARREISETPHNAIKYDESLVGVKIKIWWPDDAEFYPGVVDSYNPATMMHKVLYTDGDEEDLLLEDEIFQFPKGEKEERKCDSTPEAAEMPRKKANLSDSSVKKSKVVSSSNSGGSADKVNPSGTKPGRKRRLSSAESTGGGRAGSSKTDGSTPTESMSKERKGRRQNVDMPKHSILSEDEWNSKSKDESPRASKTEDNAKPGRKSKSETPSKLISGSKDDAASTPGVTGGPGGKKLKPSNASPGKSRSKSDANGSSKVKSGSSKQLRTEHGTTKVKPNARVLSKGSEEKSGKKRRKKSES